LAQRLGSSLRQQAQDAGVTGLLGRLQHTFIRRTIVLLVRRAARGASDPICDPSVGGRRI